jgi:hypothetical protein
MMFLTISTNYDLWLTVGETQFTHATQDCDHGALQSQRRTVGASQYDRSTLLPPTAIPPSPVYLSHY